MSDLWRAAGADFAWLMTLGAGVPTAALSLVVVYGEFADRARLGIGQGMDGLGVILLALPALFTLLWASYYLSRAWPAVVLLLCSARAGVRLRPGAAFAATSGQGGWLVSAATAGSMFVLLGAELAFPGVLYAHEGVAHVVEAAGPALVTAPAAWWGCSRVLRDTDAARPRLSPVWWVAVSGALTLLAVAGGLSVATTVRYGTADSLPGHPLGLVLSVLVGVTVTVTVGATLAAVRALTVNPSAAAGTISAATRGAAGDTPARVKRPVRYGRLAAVTGCVLVSYVLWVAGQPFLAPVVLFALTPWIGAGLLPNARTRVTHPDLAGGASTAGGTRGLPAGVTIASILLFVLAAAMTYVSAGTLMAYGILGHSKIGSDVPAGTFRLAAITSFVTAVAAILAGSGIRRGSPLARIAAILIAGLTLVLLTVDLVGGHNLNALSVLAIAAGSATVIYLLTLHTRSTAFFTKRR